MHAAMRQLVDEHAAMRQALALVREPVYFVDSTSGRIVDVNQAACDQLNRRRDDLIGESWEGVARHLGNPTTCNVDGRRFVAVGGPAEGTRATIPRDALTGLATRAAMLARPGAPADGKAIAAPTILFIDLDNFKRVNDTYGHVVGDQVLRVIAGRISESIRPGDLAIRFGGDEFIVLIDAVRRRRALDRLSRRLARVLGRPIYVGGDEIVLSASIGVSQRDGRPLSLDERIDEADRAMYRTKRQNRQSVVTHRRRHRTTSRRATAAAER
jgi:diguanylate cyclase (GGDEF)-like protein